VVLQYLFHHVADGEENKLQTLIDYSEMLARISHGYERFMAKASRMKL